MTAPDTLAVTRRVLRLLIALNFMVGALVLAMLVTSIVAPEFLMRAIGIDVADRTRSLMLDMRLLMVLGIASVPMMSRVLKSLLAIVDTVGAGDPFVGENAERLSGIGYLLLGLNLMNLAVGYIIRGPFSNARSLRMNWEFAVTPWLAVLLSFVLARVFEHGARMRADLEGTV